VAVWLALLVYLAATIGGLVYAVLRAIVLWRRLKRTGRAFRAEASRIANATETIETHLARASAAGGRLGDASRRLATSRATLEVQLQALREARHTVRRLLWFVPGI
jgi:hypothetical protein